MDDIRQNIELNYNTNAETTAKEVNVLANSVDNVTDSQNKNTTSTKKNEEGLTSFKTQLRQANQELLKVSQTYGETSQEAVKAAKKVADLKDQMAFAKDLVDKFNPDQKFKALTAATSLASTAMTGVVSGMALFGDQSEDTQKALLKVQAAMAFSQAISGLSDVSDQFKVLKTTLVAAYTSITTAKTVDTLATEANAAAENQSFLTKAKNVVVNGALAVTTGIVTAAQWLWNAAMNANPIGAIVVVVTALIAAGYALVRMFMDSSDATQKAEKANIELNKSLDNQVKAQKQANQETELSSDHQLKMAKASGKSAEEIRKLSLQLANQEVTQKYANAQTLRAIAIEAMRVAGLEDATDAQKETAKKALKEFNDANDTLKSSVLNRRKLILDNKVAERQEATDAAKKAAEDQDKINEEARKKREEEQKKRKEELKKEREQAIKDLKEFEEKVRLAEEEERLKVIDERFAKAENDLAWQKEVSEAADKIDAEFDDKKKGRKLKDLEIEKAVADGKKNIQQATIDTADKGIALAKSLGIKSKEIQKGLLIAESASGIAKIVVSTQAANAADTAASALMGPAGVSYLATKKVLNYTGAAIGVAANIAATAKALSALGGGGAPSGGSVGGTGGGASGTSAAPQITFQNSQENQIATSIGGKINEQPPIKAYMTSGDVATALLLHNKAIEENKI